MSAEDDARTARIRELIAKLVPLDSAWSNVRLAIRDYEWTIAELRKKQDRLLDELWPLREELEALEKEQKKVWRREGGFKGELQQGV